ncbi:BnaA07g37090D [Brassica napus]|uniref:Phospholipid-transporting ATPase n=1 Tax=Brassica napus TaxID=3708 RepID=A0A078IMA8_BRANA|nr:BnaA07g37090D [Brassica napus]
MAGGERKRRRRKLQLSKLFTLSSAKACFKPAHSQIGRTGFSRVVYCNQPESADYCDNYVRTTKYTLASFLPKSLFEQFRRVANFYFLVVGILSFTPLAPYTAVSAIVPLTFVILATMVKEGVEDWRRKQQDIEVNGRNVGVHQGNGHFDLKEWKTLRVGDILKVEKNDFFPADLVLLSSSYEDAVCYVETMNLDGETNLKLKQGLEVTMSLREEVDFRDFEAFIKCEDPNANLYSFVGTMELKGEKHPLSPQQLLLRGSKLRNTDYIYGAVIFTGPDTKVVQNSTEPPSKRSMIERKMDKIIYLMFLMVVSLAFLGAILFGITTREDYQNGVMTRWYLKPDDSTVFFDPQRAPLAAVCHFLSALMLNSYFIPISLYVSIEIVKVLQSIFINKDIHMYYEEADKPALARTSNLNEELGQVGTVLSDKTGTLTCNSMEFVKCSIAGRAYGRGVTEVEMAVGNGVEYAVAAEPVVKGFNFRDERIMNGKWVKERDADVIQKFLRLLAVCHTVIPEVNEDTGKISYEAESPDEAAFVIAARELGFEFFIRTQTTVSVRELDVVTGGRVERMYKVLNVLEFSSARKRMSVIVRDEDGKLLLLCKGADSVMFERLSGNGREYEEETRDHVNEYADAGLRTLILAYRELDENEYEVFTERIGEAKSSVSADREALIDEVTEKIEKDLVLLGATAVEDKLQNGVPNCIDKLAQAGIKIWVLTGDKMETAINIGFACSLLRRDMKQIIINLETPEIQQLEKSGEKDVIAEALKENVLRQITNGKVQLKASGGNSKAFALIIDGKSLAYALEDDMKYIFLELATGCASVICCRSSPKQKALVTRLVKTGSGQTTLAIGDGANDVGMLQEADIGVGISGVEGMQAVMSSDIAIAQFRYLERLLLVHGHWCYRRISKMICYFFYKNITFGFTLFLYEAYTSFSTTPAYNDWYLSLYSVLFSSLPVICLGIFDQDVSARFCLKFPVLYQEAFNHQGKPAGRDIFGGTMYTCVVWVVSLQMVLTISYFTVIQHLVVWGSVVVWYLFLTVYGSMPPRVSTDAYMVFLEALAPSPAYWITTLFVVMATMMPYFIFSAVQMQFFPMSHGTIKLLKYEDQCNDPGELELVRQASVRPALVGFTARIEAIKRSVMRSRQTGP